MCTCKFCAMYVMIHLCMYLNTFTQTYTHTYRREREKKKANRIGANNTRFNSESAWISHEHSDPLFETDQRHVCRGRFRATTTTTNKVTKRWKYYAQTYFSKISAGIWLKNSEWLLGTISKIHFAIRYNLWANVLIERDWKWMERPSQAHIPIWIWTLWEIFLI